MNGIEIHFDELVQLRQAAQLLSPFKTRQGCSAASGDYRARVHGRGMEFSEVREYQPGDDVRSMDWKVMARSGEPHTKLFHEERDRPLYILVDLSPSMFFGTRVSYKSVLATKIAALLAWAAVDHGDRVGGMVLHTAEAPLIKAKARTQGVLPLLKQMATATAASMDGAPAPKETPTFYTTLAQRLPSLARSGSTLIFISDFYNVCENSHKEWSAFKQLLHRYRVFACHTYDTLEATPPTGGHYLVSDGAQIRSLNTYSPPVRKQYENQFLNRWQPVQALLKSYHTQALSIATHDDIIKKLQQVRL